jgi:23S rRNA (uracil1939-C5)-methyltransferase
MSANEINTAVISIERIVAGGFGLGRHEERVLLVPLTAPGDRVEVELSDQRSVARLIRVVSPGPERVEPPCTHFGICGGCDLMHLSYPAQVRAKVEMVAESLMRTGGRDLLSMLTEVGIESNPRPLYSRIRATWQPTDSGTAGYFRRSSQDVIAIEHCPILDPALEEVRSSLTIRDKARGLTNGSEVSIATGHGPAVPVDFAVGDAQIVASALAFFQSSQSLLDRFVRHVVHLAADVGPGHVVELYSGVGLFTIPLAPHVGAIDAVESSPVAVTLARQNVRRNRLQNVNVHADDAGRWIAKRTGKRIRPGTVLIDPPRSGVGTRVSTGILRIKPRRIVYVSCDPATFARDARQIVDAGYRLTKLTVFDLFPQTHHTETVAAFDRVETGSGEPARALPASVAASS